MELRGRASAKELAEVFQMVASSRRPGRFTVASGERQLAFYFSPEGVTLLSNDRLRSSELAAELVAEGRLPAQNVDAVLAEQERTGGYLGQVLLRHGAVREEDVPALVFRQIQEELLGLCTWEDSTFAFDEGELEAHVRDEFRYATDFAFDPQALLVDLARRLDEWRLIEERIPSGGVIFTTAQEGGAAAAVSDLGPKATAISVLVDGQRTADEIVEASHYSRFEVLRILRQFLDSGFIRPATVAELLDRASALVKQREFLAAARLYSHLAAARPEDAVMRIKAGQLFERLQRRAEALAEYRQAVGVLLASDMPAQAKAIVDAMKALDADDLFALETSVNLRLAAGETAAAVADAQRLVPLLAKADHGAEAVKYAAILADLAPSDARAHRWLADLHRRSGQPAAAAQALRTFADLLQRDGQTAAAKAVLREIQALEDHAPPRRRAATAREFTLSEQVRRWWKVGLVSAVTGMVLAALALAVVYEVQARAAYRAVSQNAADLARHHQYREAAALFEDLARRFRFSTIADDALGSQQDLLERGRRRAARHVGDGRAGLMNALEGTVGFLTALVEQGLDEADRTAAQADEVLTATALYARARHLETQAKYAEARAVYHELVQRYPRLVDYYNVELPLTIESVPVGARVMVNGQEVGRTPLLIRHPPFAPYRIAIQHPGFEAYEATIDSTVPVHLAAELGRQPKWVFRSGGAIESAVALDGQRVFCGSRDGHVYALHAETGELIWKFDTGVLGDVTCAPVVAGRLLFVGSHDHHIYALESDTGRLRWRYQTGRLVRSTPGLIDGSRAVCVGSHDRSVYALEVNGGRLRWRFRTDGAVVGSPAADGDLVFVTSLDKRLYALSAADGSQRWRFEADGAISGSPTVADGVVYFGADDGYVYAVSRDTGRGRWSFRTGGPVEGSPCIDRNTAYVGSTDGAVYALDVARGVLRWKYQTEGSVHGAPVADARALYVASEDHCLHVVDPATGSLRWKARTGGPLVATPVLAGGVVYVGSKDQTLYAFRVPKEDAGGLPPTASRMP